MTCPPAKKPVVLQFDSDPDAFWSDFQAANPGKTGLLLEMHFDGKYAKCFASNARVHSANTSFELPDQIKANIRSCMLLP